MVKNAEEQQRHEEDITTDYELVYRVACQQHREWHKERIKT